MRGQARLVAEWIYFVHPLPEEDVARTMTEQEQQQAWAGHFEHLKRLHVNGTLIVAGPMLDGTNIGLTMFEAPDEQAARTIMEQDPVVQGGAARGELRPFHVGLLRGRE